MTTAPQAPRQQIDEELTEAAVRVKYASLALKCAHISASSVESMVLHPLLQQIDDIESRIKALQAARAADAEWSA